ncbi:unnamed protein product [Rotaria sp. Silwood2]|nr:unnamed protein product [Rotaria sp. Silwood2]
MGVNKRLNKIVHDETFTSYLTFLVCSSDSSVHPYCDSIIDRFCLQILPSIHHKIQWLNLEASSMKRILFATDYPNLSGLGLYNVDDETVKYVFNEEREGQCHVYSYPYTMQHYHGITNNFSGGLFEYVYEVSLFDELPLEHEFFLRISQSFPFMTRLSLTNNKPQNDKLCRRLNDNDHNLSVIKYLHLSELILYNAHDDYIEQFLVDTKTHLQNDTYLSIKYESLERVTHNFNRNTTRINCAKLSCIYFVRKPEFLPNLSNYFPHAEIC